MILTNAGKPVFSMNGDIYNLSPIFATLYAIISKSQTYSFKTVDQTKQKSHELHDDVLYAKEENYFGSDTLKLDERRSMSMGGDRENS